MIVYGEYELLLPDHPEIYVFTRSLNASRLLVILNFSADEPIFEWPEEVMKPRDIELLISNYAPQVHEDLRHLRLRPYEARVYLKRITSS